MKSSLPPPSHCWALCERLKQNRDRIWKRRFEWQRCWGRRRLESDIKCWKLWTRLKACYLKNILWAFIYCYDPKKNYYPKKKSYNKKGKQFFQQNHELVISSAFSSLKNNFIKFPIGKISFQSRATQSCCCVGNSRDPP